MEVEAASERTRQQAGAWARPWPEVLEESGSSPQGLSNEQVKKRRRRFGPNRLKEAKRRSVWALLGAQFKSLIILLLSAAAVVSFLFGQWVEGVAIAAVIVINGAIGFVTELQAVRSMEALRRLSKVNARVRREGRVAEIPAEELVPGDMVVVEAGDIVTADLRLVEASKLQVDESALTGESVPVGKSVDPVDEDAPLTDRASMLFKGTAVTRGSGEGVVVATGTATELGQISALVEEAEEEVTPLERRLNRLGHRLIWVTLAIAAVVAVSGVLAGRQVLLMIETSIALAVAAIPEGLPIVATLALARGMWRMARRNALINRLSAVETLGATNIICTDKTGTLTENRMAVARYELASGAVGLTGEGFRADGRPVSPAEDRLLRVAMEVGVLCNNASFDAGNPDGNTSVGDPMEVALLAAGARGDIRRDALAAEAPEVREVAFDPEVKMMATYHRTGDQIRVAVKGAPEAAIPACSALLTTEGPVPLTEEGQAEWLAASRRMAEEGLRTLAVAQKVAADPDEPPYQGLTLVGLVGLHDPPRQDVREAIAQCRAAGIRVAMVTGDQPATARSIAIAVGLTGDPEAPVVAGAQLKRPAELTARQREELLRVPIFARVSPRQKLDLVALYQEQGQVVAMTGDGVNDAPALKKADIGVAMGRRGTEVARQAADMVLKDDAFPTIVAAVAQGRVIFDNIRKFVLYLLSCNVSEILAVAFASLAGVPLPILPLQILFLNLVTDVFPALALAGGEGDPDVMQRPPRHSGEPILTRGHWLAVVGYGLAITTAVLGALTVGLHALRLPVGQAVTMSFLTLAFAQLWHVFNMRDLGTGPLGNDIVRNRFVWGALALCSGLLVGSVYLPTLSAVLKTETLPARAWGLVLGMSLLPWSVGQVVHRWSRARRP